MSTALWLALAGAALLIGGRLSRALLNNPRGDVEGGIVWHTARFYSRIVHSVRVEGAERIPGGPDAGPLIVIANHTSGVDPVLLQAVCPFEIRWMMAENMRHPAGEWLWRWSRVIFVTRGGGEIAATREAIRHLAEGGVLGIFPEGGIERPPQCILSFLGGVGVIVKRTGAPVLPFVVDGTPSVDPAWASLYRLSRARIRVMPPLDYSGSRLSAAEIARDLERKYMEWTGWPLCPDDPEPPGIRRDAAAGAA